MVRTSVGAKMELARCRSGALAKAKYSCTDLPNYLPETSERTHNKRREYDLILQYVLKSNRAIGWP